MEQLKKEDKMVSKILEQVAVGIVCASPEGKFLRVNQRFSEIVGYPQEDILKFSFKDITYPDDLESNLEQFEKLSKGISQNFSMEKRYIRKDKSLVWVNLSVSLVRDANGKTDYYIGIIEDISKRKLFEEQIIRQNKSMKFELEMAAKVQQELLPINCPNNESVKFSWKFKPKVYVAGDMLNVFSLDPDNIGIYILDAKGHGVSAALKAVTISHMLKAFSDTESCMGAKIIRNQIYSPSKTISYLNQKFTDNSGGDFFTIFYGVLNIKTLTLSYSLAGHIPPVLMSNDGSLSLINRGGPAVGILPNALYLDYTLDLNSGDKMLLYTDGIVEAEDIDGNQFGLERMLNILDTHKKESVSVITTTTMEEIEKHVKDCEPQDDISILAFEIT